MVRQKEVRQLVREQYCEIRRLLWCRVTLHGRRRRGEKTPEKLLQQRRVRRVRRRGGRWILGKDIIQEARENDNATRTVGPEAVRESIPRVGVINDNQGVRRTGYDV